MNDCLFCRVLAGEVPSHEVASSATTYEFRDISPTAPTHVLVIPPEHIADAAAIGPEHAAIVAEMVLTAQEVAATEGLTARGYRLVFNVGEDASNSVPHLHLHVIGGRHLTWPPG